MDKERRIWIVRRGKVIRRVPPDRREKSIYSDGQEPRLIVRRLDDERRKDTRRRDDS